MTKKAPKESIRFSRILELGGLEVIKASYRHHHFPKHFHDGFAFGIIERGVQATECRGATHIAVAGEICLVNPGEVHTGYTADDQGWSYRCCYPSADLVSEIACQGNDRASRLPHFPSPVIRDPVVYDHFYRLFKEIEDFQHVLGLQENLIAAISSVVDRHSTRGSSFRHHDGATRHIKRARDYIEEHWADQTRLEDIAIAAEIDCYCLIRTFKRCMGMTPHAYLMQRRIEKGKSLLLAGLSPARVAVDSGFFDQSHFTKQFKRYTGVTPADYICSRDQKRGERTS